MHRPRYDDWAFPKGKAFDDETDEETADREVQEETGFRCERGPEVGAIRYLDHLGRPKAVRYWMMYPAGGSFVPNAEVDELRWVEAGVAHALLSHEHDRLLLTKAQGFDRPVYLVRHAKAGNREAWVENDLLRPLSRKGRVQAEGLVDLFQGREIDHLMTSPSLRCMQTVRPLALSRSLPIGEHDELAEVASIEDALSFARSSGGSVVMCSHGDVISSLVQTLVSCGVEMLDPPAWKKGSTWILERDGGLFTSLRYLAPPG